MLLPVRCPPPTSNLLPVFALSMPPTPHSSTLCVGRLRVLVVRRGGIGAKEGERGAGGRWDETSHTSRKGSEVKVKKGVLPSILNCAVGLETHTGGTLDLPHNRNTLSDL